MGQTTARILTLDEIAEHLKMHRDTISHMAHAGEIPAMRIGRRWRFDLSRVEQALYKKATQASEQGGRQ